ncbi:RagB/SusD family nutrient uptake outer membrane protein, partial [Pseudoxanthomonas sp. SGD-10]
QRSSALTGPEVYIYGSSDEYVRNAWRYLYEGIERANVFLDKVENADMSNEKKATVVAEAKFLRAYYYFVLASNYGEVPLKTTPSASVNAVDAPKANLKTIYDFITSEMEAAEADVLPITAYNHAGRVTQSAVRGILARVYLKMAGAPLSLTAAEARPYFEKAAEWAGKLVNPTNGDYQHTLVQDYTQLFKDMAADKYNTQESIWEVEFYGNRIGDFEAGRHGNIAGIQMGNEEFGKRGRAGFSYGFILATKKLVDAYGTGSDERRDWNVAPYRITMGNNNQADASYTEVDATGNAFNRYSAKFRRDYEVALPRHKNYTPINFPLLRYSDVLLMYAEAKNELGEVSEAGLKVKEVRDRANAADSTATIGGDQELMRQFIKNERFRELAYEGLRKFDLVRWGEFVGTMSSLSAGINASAPDAQKYTRFGPGNVSTKHNLLPIPSTELSLNKAITQNPGW